MITTCRVVISVALLFFPLLSISFFWCYTTCVLSDILDGWIARSTKTESRLGARLDSLADMVFGVVMAVKLLPIMVYKLPVLILLVGLLVAIIKISAYIVGWARFHTFASLHTRLNKVSGILIILMPLLLIRNSLWLISIICFVTAASAIEELAIECKASIYNPNIKSIFEIR